VVVVVVVVVVVAVVAVVEVEVEAFGLVVVGCGRVGSGGEVGSGAGAPLKDALVAELEVASVPSPSTRLSPLAFGPAPGSLVVGPTLLAPGPVVSGPATPRGAVPLEGGATRSAPVSSSHPGPQRLT
jgi:hypothetical protein